MKRVISTILFACAIYSPASAQTATIAVSHDDADGVLSPGETVRIVVRHERTTGILAGLAGDLRATGNLGLASNIASDLRLLVHGLTYPASHGSVQGGSVIDVSYEFVSHPIFVSTVQSPYLWPTVDALSFDWTAPSVSTPTTVNFDWIPSTAYPNVYAIIPPYSGFHWAFLPTTYTGASVLVLPAPTTLAVLLTPAFVPRKRRHAGR